MEFYKRNGKFSTSELMNKNSGLERYLRQSLGGVRYFCEKQQIEYILKDKKIINWNIDSAIDTIKDLHKKSNKFITKSVLAEYNLTKLYQWIERNYDTYETFCLENNINSIAGKLINSWNTAKCFRLIKDINKNKHIKPNAEYIKINFKGAYNYILTNYDKFINFIELFDLHDFVDLSHYMTIGEKEIESFLLANNLKYSFQFPVDKYKFDFAIFDSDNFIRYMIEFDGEQHFKPVEYFGGIEGHKKNAINDNIKNDYCISNNIKLIRIKYSDINDIDKMLSMELKELLNNKSKDNIIDNVSINTTKNLYNNTSEYGSCILYNTGRVIYFDLEDYEKIKEFCWKEDLYNQVYTKINNKKYYLSKYIINLYKHGIKNFTLKQLKGNYDFRKENMVLESIKRNDSNSGLTGIWYRKDTGMWVAELRLNNTKKVKSCRNKEEAIDYREKWLKEYYQYLYKTC